ncbi:MAG: hypothetical protein LCH81_18050 [Bacteroidetes bacterium]|nr:hypothetical protein [Bacteroidota bacterium]
MKTNLIVCCLFLLAQARLSAQTDSAETLQWIENQSGKIDTLLQDALNNPDQLNLVFRLMDAYLLFDAVAMAGVYCTDIRESAQMGRNLTDVLNYRLEKDMNSGVVRASEARIQAEKMRVASQACRNALPADVVKTLSPADIVREDVRHIELMLNDGLAVGDMHILSQKIEYALRVLQDIKNLANTLPQCSLVAAKAETAILHAEAALAARNWTETTRSVQNALGEIGRVATISCR